MIQWCAYCQSFLGQLVPFDDFSVTHGMCADCASRFEEFDSGTIAPVTAFYGELFSQVGLGRQIDPWAFLKEVDRLGLSRADAYLGILHPLLWRVGREFQEGRLTVAEEHLFTEAVQSILRIIGFNEAREACDVLLVVAPGNDHTIGVEIMLRLIDEQTDLTAARGLAPRTPDDLKALVARHQPRILGISAALPEHLPYLQSLRDWVDDLPGAQRPHMVVGGPAVVTASEAIPAGFQVCEPYDVGHGLGQLVSLAAH